MASALTSSRVWYMTDQSRPGLVFPVASSGLRSLDRAKRRGIERHALLDGGRLVDPRFETYFRERLQEYWLRLGPGSPILEESASAVARSAVLAARPFAAQEFGRPLRSDSELLLYLGLTELVVRPVLAVRGVLPDLGEAIANDVRLIVANAAQETEQNHSISAHAIVNATSRLWPELQTGSFDLWG